MKQNIKQKIEDTLLRGGFSPALMGFGYIVTAVLLVLEQPDLMQNITKGLYPAVAQRHHTTASRVERAIRHGIEQALSRRFDDIQKILILNTDADKGKYTNSEFIALVVMRMGREVDHG